MTTRIFLSTILVFILASCTNNGIQDKPQQETPKALGDNSSLDIVSKGRRSDDLLESLYSELVSKDVELKRLEEKINTLNSSKSDSLELIDKFNGKIQSYFRSIDSHVSAIEDSLLRDKMKLLIAGNLAKYNSRIAKHNELLKNLAINEIRISDLHTVLKIVRTLPVIEKYQQDNLPTTSQLEGFIKQQYQTINLADTLIKK
jgi:peptidoglycan hydrolase CwlO-like protein